MSDRNTIDNSPDDNRAEKAQMAKIMKDYNIEQWMELMANHIKFKVDTVFPDHFIISDCSNGKTLLIDSLRKVIDARLELNSISYPLSNISERIYVTALFCRSILSPKNLTYEEMMMIEQIKSERLDEMLKEARSNWGEKEVDEYLGRISLQGLPKWPVSHTDHQRFSESSILN
ncbi:MAG: hypothetical protein ACD_2C00050G0003 [uncultured bacterium (gcode 4)]|uniref:Uncharacterized protein n=1 Tax=uncultured bacterium (gcode 4) TaxID=1234023 RepID=K2G490_9BACT|nr:MAG: hypothetical protein ACD_2C00050G0003 [uncultured bacterium (gcode 4)]